VIKRDLAEDIRHKVDRVVRRSVEYAFAKPGASRNFVKEHAQEMNEDVMNKHIALYVNDYSIDLGSEGKRAVKLLFDKAQELGVIEKIEEEIFLINKNK
jgi:1,4-dihydroxy-6-naphthoate synthase